MKREKKIDSRVKAFLMFLKGGRWHWHNPLPTLTVSVVRICMRLGLVDYKETPVGKRAREFRVHFRITPLGRKVLKEGKVPNREDVRVVSRVMRQGLSSLPDWDSDRYIWNQLFGKLNSYAH